LNLYYCTIVTGKKRSVFSRERGHYNIGGPAFGSAGGGDLSQ